MTGFVYAIAAENGLVKIGYSEKPRLRLNKINSDASSRCTLVGCVEATREQEAALHRMLEPSRANGEWYRRETAVQVLLGMLPQPPKEHRERQPATVLEATLRAHGLTLAGFSRKMGMRRPMATKWAQRRIPADRLVEIERATGIPRQELRPDLFPVGHA